MKATASRRRRSKRQDDRRNVSEAVCKPSFVPRTSRYRGDGHPSGAAGHPTAHAADPRAGQRPSPPPTVARDRVTPSYLALLRVEFAPFHSDRRLAPPAGIVTVALVLASRRTGVTRYPALAELGLSSRRTGRPADARPSDRLADGLSLPRGTTPGQCHSQARFRDE